MKNEWDTFSVKTSDGRRRTVHVPREVGKPVDASFTGFPPNTARMARTATACKGENYHGSLDEDLYVTLDEPSDPSRYVMWAGDNGSQADDDAPRLRMVSSCDLPNWEEEEPESEGVSSFLKPATEALLYGYLRLEARFGSIDELEFRCSEGGVLTDESVDAVLAQAIQDTA